MPQPLKLTCLKFASPRPLFGQTMQGVIGETVKPRTSKTFKTEIYSRGILAAGDRRVFRPCLIGKSTFPAVLPIRNIGPCLIPRLPTREGVRSASNLFRVGNAVPVNLAQQERGKITILRISNLFQKLAWDFHHKEPSRLHMCNKILGLIWSAFFPRLAYGWHSASSLASRLADPRYSAGWQVCLN
jgi:hypothetical protein